MIGFESNDTHATMLRDLAPDLTPMLDILFILLVFFLLIGFIFWLTSLSDKKGHEEKAPAAQPQPTET